LSRNRMISENQEFKDDKIPSQEQISSLLEHYQNRRFDDAEKLAISITQEFPKYQFGWKLLGALLKQTARVSESLAPSQKSVQLAPQDAEAHNNLGATLKELGRLDEAVASYTQAIALKPDYAEAHNNLGNTLKELGRLDEAEASYKQAIALKPDYAEAHNNLGNTLKELGRLDEAEASYKQAIALKKDFYLNMLQPKLSLSHLLHDIEKFEDAIDVLLLNVKKKYYIEDSQGQEKQMIVEESPFSKPRPLEYPEHFRAGMGTENVAPFLRSMVQLTRPSRILEIGAGYTTPFLLEGLVNNERLFDDGNFDQNYLTGYEYSPKLVVIDDMSQGDLAKKAGMSHILNSEYTHYIEGLFQGKAKEIHDEYGEFDFVWFDCGSISEYQAFFDEYWGMCSKYIFFHYTYYDGEPNDKLTTILRNIGPKVRKIDIIETHKTRQGSITMLKKGSE